jgi:hypothetical protein
MDYLLYSRRDRDPTTLSGLMLFTRGTISASVTSTKWRTAANITECEYNLLSCGEPHTTKQVDFVLVIGGVSGNPQLGRYASFSPHSGVLREALAGCTENTSIQS